MESFSKRELEVMRHGEQFVRGQEDGKRLMKAAILSLINEVAMEVAFETFEPGWIMSELEDRIAKLK